MRKYDDDTEYSVGEKFAFRDTILQVVEVKEDKCIYPACYFRLNAVCGHLDVLCSREDRDDGKSVMFIEIGQTGKVVDIEPMRNRDEALQIDMFAAPDEQVANRFMREKIDPVRIAPENTTPLQITIKE